jgi:23S rRNA (uracil1939-C5)-methyltransferase
VTAANVSPDLYIGQELELFTEDVGYEGQAVARAGDQVFFVDYAIPGEKVRVVLERRAKGLWFGRAIDVLEPSPDRVEARCPYYGVCGGCQWQHIDYEAQLRLKTKIVIDQMRKLGRFAEPPVLATIPSPAPWFYRNQIRLTVDAAGNPGFARRRTHDQVDIEECVVAQPGINRRLAKLRGKAPPGPISLRASQVTGETLLEHGGGEKQVYHEEVAGRRFRISGPSFFQINTHTAEIIVDETWRRLELGPQDRLLDVYAGVGLFAAIFGREVAEVVAIEESPSAVGDAMFNTLHLENVTFYQGRAEAILGGLKARPFDAAIVDPPRAGLKAPVIDYLLSKAVDRLVYVSCDPSTLARDLRLLVDGGYLLTDVQPIDQFPQTYHVECVAGLRQSPP